MKDWNKELRQRILTDLLTGITYTNASGTIPVKAFYELLPKDASNYDDKIYIILKSIVGAENELCKTEIDGTVNFILDIVGGSQTNNNLIDIESVVSSVKAIMSNFEARKTNFYFHPAVLTLDQSFSDLSSTNVYCRRVLRYETKVNQVNYTYS